MEPKFAYEKDACVPVFIVALFAIGKLWNLDIYQWMNGKRKYAYIHNGMSLSHKEIISFPENSMNIIIMVNKISQSQKDKHDLFSPV